MVFRIKEARSAAGIAQKDLAARLGISAATLSGYESGAHDPKSDMLSKIADLCGVTVDFLLGRGPVPPRDAGRHGDPLLDSVIENYGQLNDEGRERLAEYADDLVCSGKYIKSRSVGMAKKA